ncbi:MAG: RNA-binding protein [Desulfuromonadaceae bacterium]|nr:RNA-binding protein [Desulfuromonadaceae bacterium]
MIDKSTNKDLFVSDISFNAGEEDVRKLFAVCGTVRSVHLLTDPKSGKFKGCAFVRMATASEAKDALNTLDGTLLIDYRIHVQAARPKNSTTLPKAPAPEKRQKTRHSRHRGK